jgi:hypothetical protein
MKGSERRKKVVVLAAASACGLAVGYGTLAFERGSAAVSELKSSDASSILNLFPPVQAPASIPGDSR